MSSFVNCFKFWCYVREKGDKKDKPEYKEMKMIDKNLVITKSPTLVYSCMMIGRDKKGFEGLGLGN